MLFDFLFMDSYENRKVENTKINGAVIDTCLVNDSDKPYETGIKHANYNSGQWIIVELYDTKEQAQSGHKKWVEIFKKELPKHLKDVSTCELAKLSRSFSEDEDNDFTFDNEENN